MHNSPIHVVTTGGTFDVERIDANGKYHFTQSKVPGIVEIAGIPSELIRYTHHEPIDSLEMKDSHREMILTTLMSIPENRIVLTHGTDTMVETAQFLHHRITWKTIVLVGAMIPANKPGSDAQMNLGFAIGALKSMTQTWVRIAMNGQLFLPYSVMKDRTTTPPHFRKP